MKFYVLTMFLANAAAGSILLNSEMDEHWDIFKKNFEKDYDELEDIKRRLIFEENIGEIIGHNLRADMGLHSYEKGINEFTDMTAEELTNLMGGCVSSDFTSINGSTFLEPFNIQIPNTIDWRRYGLVTPVKNQKNCGSCWAFSATGALEGQYKRRTKRLISLSEQNLVDCTKQYGNHGCNGGWMGSAFEYIKRNRGVDVERAYPYQAKEGPCRFKRNAVGATCTGFVNLPSGNEEALKRAVGTIGPIAVAVDVPKSFYAYKRGVYNEPRCNNKKLAHAVLVVGYGRDRGRDYWLVKNSWGTRWGMGGYIKMSRNSRNQCGIATAGLYPLV